jgi:hypothetical protein
MRLVQQGWSASQVGFSSDKTVARNKYKCDFRYLRSHTLVEHAWSWSMYCWKMPRCRVRWGRGSFTSPNSLFNSLIYIHDTCVAHNCLVWIAQWTQSQPLGLNFRVVRPQQDTLALLLRRKYDISQCGIDIGNINTVLYFVQVRWGETSVGGVPVCTPGPWGSCYRRWAPHPAWPAGFLSGCVSLRSSPSVAAGNGSLYIKKNMKNALAEKKSHTHKLS